MTETKYGKYFIEWDGSRVHPLGPFLARLDNNVVKGSHFYMVHWVLPRTENHLGDYPYAGHPPHIHRDAELLFHLGTNPDDPMDLGAEVEIYMGPELERHVITRTTVIYIPPNFIHAPWRPLKTVRPWIFIEVNQGPMHTEKSFKQVLPKEARERVDWSRWKDEGY
jgi:hypothetical protein